MKRFTETLKWRDPWFRLLSSPAKLLWFYACDHADLVGCVELNLKLVSEDLGVKVAESHLSEIGHERLQPMDAGRFFMPKFIHFQYGELSDACTPHRKILAEMDRKGIHRVGLGYAMGSLYPTPSHLEKPDTHRNGEDRKKTGKEEEGGVGDLPVETIKQLPTHLNTARMQNKWQSWQTVRRGYKKPSSWLSLFNEQVEFLSKHDEPTAFEILSASIRNGWQGLFEPRNQSKVLVAPSQRPQALNENL